MYKITQAHTMYRFIDFSINNNLMSIFMRLMASCSFLPNRRILHSAKKQSIRKERSSSNKVYCLKIFKMLN